MTMHLANHAGGATCPACGQPFEWDVEIAGAIKTGVVQDAEGNVVGEGKIISPAVVEHHAVTPEPPEVWNHAPNRCMAHTQVAAQNPDGSVTLAHGGPEHDWDERVERALVEAGLSEEERAAVDRTRVYLERGGALRGVAEAVAAAKASRAK